MASSKFAEGTGSLVLALGSGVVISPESAVPPRLSAWNQKPLPVSGGENIYTVCVVNVSALFATGEGPKPLLAANLKSSTPPFRHRRAVSQRSHNLPWLDDQSC